MAEITRERQGEMVREVLAVLRLHPEGLQARKVISEVETRLGLTDFEKSDYPSTPGVRRFEKILRFNTIPAVKAGWLLKSKGVWTVTAEGEAALEKFTDPAEFMRESVRRYRAWKKAQPEDDDSTEDVEAEDETEVLATSGLEEARESAWDGIRTYVAAMNSYAFQDLAAALLEAMGYHVAWVSPPGPDQGLDILAYRDPLGTEDPRIKVQVKQRPDAKTNPDGIRSFMAILGSSDVGIFIATGGFTPEARREARNQESRRVTLIDLDRFVELWIEHHGNLDETKRQLLPLEPVYFIAPPT
jgi:restriction system protein